MKHRLFKPEVLLGNANHNYNQEFNNHFQLKTSALGWMINACLLVGRLYWGKSSCSLFPLLQLCLLGELEDL